MYSFIVAVYKTATYLPKCLNSILMQSQGNFEALLVDDGSPDKCAELCDDTLVSDARLCVLHQANGGVSSARNAGLAEASGEWVWFVDSDDTIATFSLEQFAHEIERHPKADLHIFNCGYVQEEFAGDLELFLHRYYFTYILGFGPWNKLYRLSLIRQGALCFDQQETVGEDLLFNMRYYQQLSYIGDIQASFIGKDFYHYLSRPGSAMNTGSPRRLEQQLRLYDKIKRLLGCDVSKTTLAYVFLLHLFAGINQAKVGGLRLENFANWDFDKYSQELSDAKSVMPEFFQNEHTSHLGKLRTRLFLLLMKYGYRSIAGLIMGLTPM